MEGCFCGEKKEKKLWNSIPLFIFWMVWNEWNRLTFVYNIWGWAKLYIGEEPHSLLGFLEWLASR